MAFILTAAGLNLQANNLLNGTLSGVNKITLGSGRRDPDGTETQLVAPLNPVRELADPSGFVDGAVGVVDYVQEGDASAFVVNEAGLWVDDLLVAYASSAGGSIFTKTANQRIVHRFQWTTANGELSTFTFASALDNPAASEATAGIVRLASQGEVNAGADAVKPVTPATLGGWWNQLSVPASKLSGLISLARIPSLPASRITSGVLALARIPGLPASIITSGALAVARIPSLPASILGSGSIAIARIPSLPASIIGSGLFNRARLPTATATENGVLKVRTLTEAQYDALNPKDADTLYLFTS